MDRRDESRSLICPGSPAAVSCTFRTQASGFAPHPFGMICPYQVKVLFSLSVVPEIPLAVFCSDRPCKISGMRWAALMAACGLLLATSLFPSPLLGIFSHNLIQDRSAPACIPPPSALSLNRRTVQPFQGNTLETEYYSIDHPFGRQ